MEDAPKDTRRILTREEFDKDQKLHRDCLETLKKFDDFEKKKHMFVFDIMTYEEYMVKYQKLYKMPLEDGGSAPVNPPITSGIVEEKNIVVDSIEE